MKEEDPENLYFIYNCNFIAAILSFKIQNEDRNVLMPISYLKEFKNIREYQVKDIGLKKSNTIIELEESK